MLRSSGVPTPVTGFASTASDAVRIAGEIGFPVVLKVVSGALGHTSDVGGVRLGLVSADEVGRACNEVLDHVREAQSSVDVEGFLVAEYLPCIEMIVGIASDPTFGPVVLVGIGGTAAEAMDGVALGLPPLTSRQAHRTISSLRASALLGAPDR